MSADCGPLLAVIVTLAGGPTCADLPCGGQAMDSRIVEVAIGLTFVFAALAGAMSLITTGISSLLQLHSELLLRGLRSLLDGAARSGCRRPGEGDWDPFGVLLSKRQFEEAETR
jgi:hypothetical protein